MSEIFTNVQEFKKLINIPFAVIIASSIIIIITTNMTNRNGLIALLGGYSGLLLGLLFIIILNLIFIKTSYLNTLLNMVPIITVMIIVGLLLYYLNIYFDRILKSEVSSYYFSFSLLSLILIAVQIITIFNAIYSNAYEQNTKLFSNTTFSLLVLINVINIIVVFTIGIVLHFYSTEC